MRSRIVVLTISAALGLAFSASESLVSAARPHGPSRFVGALDGAPVTVARVADGTTWAAWAWRSGREYDLAISSADASGAWSTPTFIGRYDGMDQVEPALAADAEGNLYLAFVERPAGCVRLAVLPAGAESWSAPIAVTLEGRDAANPALSVVAGRLVLAYRTGGVVSILVLPIAGSAASPLGIQDGPDPVSPAGATPKGDDGSSDGSATPLGGSPE